MRVLEIKVMKGPSYWSITQTRLIVMTLDLEETITTQSVLQLQNTLSKAFPSLQLNAGYSQQKDYCGKEVVATAVTSLAVALIKQAGVSTPCSKTEATSKHGIYRVIFSYDFPASGKYAAKASVRIVDALLNTLDYNLHADFDEVKRLWESEKFGPSTGSIVSEAQQRNIPIIRLDDDSLVQLGYGVKQKRIEATIASTTSNIAVELAGNKESTKNILKAAGIPVPEGTITAHENDLSEAINEIGFPLVLKPVDGNHGKGATTNITSPEDALIGFKTAKAFSKNVIVEKFISGYDFRVLVIDYKFVAAALRTPASVTGDGISTIEQLVHNVNQDKRRGQGHDNVLTRIELDDVSLQLINKAGYTLNSILQAGEQLFLKPTANLSSGGTATDVTGEVDAGNIALFERIARTIGLDICGIDVIAPDLYTPLEKNGGTVLEVNAAPGFRMHLEPTSGLARNVAMPVIDMLFPENDNGRIPIIAVTGTNGKTTTTRLIAHIEKTIGHKVGYTTTDGVYIDNNVVMKGDCAGPGSAEMVLRDPLVEVAVLECARGGMLRSGLAFSQCDVAVITNVAEDHLGLNGIDTIEELARVKSVLAQTVHAEGYAVLNADDDLVYNMKNTLNCKVALFSLNDKNVRVKQHIQNGGIAAVYERNFVTILHGNKKIRIERVDKIPLTFGGKAEFNIANTLGAAVAAYVQKIRIEDIRKALTTFIPGEEVTPGRMNIFDFKEFTVMLDYAHNPHGMQAIGKFLQHVDVRPKVGVIAGVGDRRNEDLISLGEEASKIFDEIIIRLDKDLRGRTANELTSLVSKGVKQHDPLKMIRLFESEREAVEYVLSNAVTGSYIVVLSDTISESLEQIKEAKARKDSNTLPYVQSLSA